MPISDPQFERVERRVTITREAVIKAIALPPIALATQDLFDEFFLAICARVKAEAWHKGAEGGVVRLDVGDIKDE